LSVTVNVTDIDCQCQSSEAVKTASEMTYTVSGGALNSTQYKSNPQCYCVYTLLLVLNSMAYSTQNLTTY